MLRMLCCWPQVLAGLKYAEAQGPSLQQSSSQLGTNLVGNWGSSGQGCSTSVYPPSPNLVDISRGDAGQSCSPSVQSSLPQGMPFGGTLQGSTEGLDKAAQRVLTRQLEIDLLDQAWRLVLLHQRLHCFLKAYMASFQQVPRVQ